MKRPFQQVIGVRQLSTNELRPNPHNPRVLFDKLPLDDLKNSIKRVGILVPLTVYQDPKDGEYVILDGQRRWLCAQTLKLTEVPANVVEAPTLVQNIVTMFQIHKLRDDWALMPTALKLDLLMKEVKDTNNKRVAALTALDEAVVVRCKKLLSYEKKYQDMMLDANPEKRVKADFFIELYPVRTDRNVVKMRWFKRVRFTDQMLEKMEARGLRAVTDFRTVKQHITNAVKANRTMEVSKRLREFAETRTMPVESLEISAGASQAEARGVTRDIRRLIDRLAGLDVPSMYGENDLWTAAEELARRLGELLRSADRRTRS